MSMRISKCVTKAESAIKKGKRKYEITRIHLQLKEKVISEDDI